MNTSCLKHMGNIFTTQISCSCDVLISRCLDCIGGRCVYVSELEQNLRILDTSINELESLKNDVMTRIDIEERQGRKRLNHVQRWLSVVDIKVDKITKLSYNHQQQVAKLCIGGCCSTNYVSSYKFGKKVVRRMNEVDDLIKQEQEFKEVTRMTLPEATVEIPCDPTVGLEQKLDTVYSYLLGGQVDIVGLYGESGVGKTVFLKQVNNKFSETSRFDLVIWITVSKSYNLDSIQNDIGKRIGFYGEEWGSKSRNEKATYIFRVLKRKKFLILLDDIWEQINLTELGIPLRMQNVSKVVFSTRFEIICGQMRAQKRVKVEPLEWDDSWRLFSDIIGEDSLQTLNSNPEMNRLAKELVSNCGGVPRFIVETAKDMACKRTTQDWANAVKSLRSPLLDSQEAVEIEKYDGKCATTVFGRPITDKTLREMPQYASGEQITAIDRAKIALDMEKEDGKDVKARKYVRHLKKKKYGDRIATICLFYNATGSTLKASGHHNWHGYLKEGLQPLTVENGQWGVFVHMNEDTKYGRGGSTGAIVYNGENGFQEKRDWVLAWNNPLNDQANKKVYTEVREENHFHLHWIHLYPLLMRSYGQCSDNWGRSTSYIALEDVNGVGGPFFEATFSIDQVC